MIEKIIDETSIFLHGWKYYKTNTQPMLEQTLQYQFTAITDEDK